jgi:hypothetical protein
MSRDPAVGADDARPRGEKIITWPLAVFLAAVAAILSGAAWTKFRTPGADEAVRELADGDLDGEERVAMLRHLLAAALRSTEPREQWAGLMAAVSLGDGPGHATLQANLAGSTFRPAAEDREWLALGDPMLRNVLTATIAAAEGRTEDAAVAWRRVEAQSRLTGHAFAGELAAAALRH